MLTIRPCKLGWVEHCARMDQCARMRPSQPNLTPHVDATPAWINVQIFYCARMHGLPSNSFVHTIVTVSPPNCDLLSRGQNSVWTKEGGQSGHGRYIYAPSQTPGSHF